MNIIKSLKSTSLLVVVVMVAFTIFASQARATTSVLIGGVSHHIGAQTYTYHGVTKDLQERNAMLGFEQDGYSVFAFRNSYDKFSVGVGYTPRHQLTDNLSVGVRLGVTSGYQDTPVGWIGIPFIGPEVDYRMGSFHVVGGYLPSFTGDSKGILTLNFKWDIQE